MSFFARVFRSKDASSSKKQSKQNGVGQVQQKPQWTDAFLRTEVSPEEVQELLHGCTIELKSRGLEIPFLLLPFRPNSDPSSARTFIRHYFSPPPERPEPLRGKHLSQELRLTEPMVLCSIMKWCWSRLPGGVVTWEAYELFKVGEQDSQFARDAFSTFIPLSVESDARTKIILDFFDLMSAVAAHGKTNGFGGRKLSRYAGWWAFDHTDSGNGFESSYKNWASAADATSHLFFAYLRSLSPDSIRGSNGISTLPISLQNLVQATEYPPEPPTLLQVESTKVVMIVDTVSPTPFALLRRAKNFEYRDSDLALQQFSNFDDPVRALTDECRRVLRCISSTNQSNVSAAAQESAALRDASWSRFEDLGFTDTIEEGDGENDGDGTVTKHAGSLGLRSAPHSRTADLGRPTTPSWADFLSSGFADENEPQSRPPFLLPPDKVLPPIQTVRGQSSQSHKRMFDQESSAEPGELASITTMDLDASFWWVWISSLSGEEPTQRKAVFGRCALIETSISGGRWFVLEEQVKGAAPEPEVGAYIAEKKGFFGFRSRKGRLIRRKSAVKKISTIEEPYQRANSTTAISKTSIGPDQHARIQAAAAALQRKHREQEQEQERAAEHRNKSDDLNYSKSNSIMSMQPLVMTEVSQAMKWANNYDKNAVRAAYLGNNMAGTGAPAESLQISTNRLAQNGSLNPSSSPPDCEHPVPSKEDANASQFAAEQSEISKNTASDLDPATTPASEPPAIHSVETASPERARGKKSLDSTEEHKKLKKKPGNTTLKGMFSKKTEKVEQPPVKPTGAETSAVAAARAALEGRTAQVAQPSTLAPSKLPTAHRLSGFGRKKPSESSPPQTNSKPNTPPVPEEPKTAHTPVTTPYDGPPWTRREKELDALSRVDTNEKARADREFSSFDHQAPFVDQPAFVPADSPTTEEFPERDRQTHHPPAKQQAPVNGHDKPEPMEKPMALQDRWAQIRKNAAERAVHIDDHPSRRPEPEKTDDGETSGEETIESRVARIKARVAELTGNMES
ncbi:uncharacterized protein PADG_04189 [Paracoccidioides brasiliensis Pb18]|uniref:Meiotically up-regulated protein Msb1/Mug8 domain-containing protein n=1 Tax=Paracoccidioides brasiliensis (strain Pb18) TaxID=502780 RepID=C1GAA3_PARBD|nr:uncharacterized protein PADG_04189 [Paracoccidioides brasiliensis Pb18]EEH48105.1 hypothetical protein PADG_04189 [Paracoccidioides brasiliensis Pb18]